MNPINISSAIAAEARKDYLSKDGLLKVIRKYHRTKNESEKNSLRDQVVHNNLRLVLKIAISYANRNNISADDLFQCGIIGIIVALDKFKASKKFAFSTYATWWVIKYIRDEIYSNNIIDTKRFAQGAPKARLYKKLLIKSDGDYDKFEKMLRKNGISRKTQDHIERIITIADHRSFLSLSSPLTNSDESSFSLADVIEATGPSPESEVMKKSLHHDLRKFIDNELTDREATVIRSIYFNEMNVRAVATMMKCSGATIRIMELRAIRKLKRKFKAVESENKSYTNEKFASSEMSVSDIIKSDDVKVFLTKLRQRESLPANQKPLHLYEMVILGRDAKFSVLSPSMRGAINFVRERTSYQFDIDVVSVDNLPNPARGLNYFLRDMDRSQVKKTLAEIAASRWQ